MKHLCCHRRDFALRPQLRDILNVSVGFNPRLKLCRPRVFIYGSFRPLAQQRQRYSPASRIRRAATALRRRCRIKACSSVWSTWCAVAPRFVFGDCNYETYNNYCQYKHGNSNTIWSCNCYGFVMTMPAQCRLFPSRQRPKARAPNLPQGFPTFEAFVFYSILLHVLYYVNTHYVLHYSILYYSKIYWITLQYNI